MCYSVGWLDWVSRMGVSELTFSFKKGQVFTTVWTYRLSFGGEMLLKSQRKINGLVSREPFIKTCP